jgi:hypothetical protein
MRQYNIHLRFPDLITVQLGGPGSEALVPLELLNVVPGTIYRGKIPPEITKDVLQFMDQRPEKRLETILSGIQVHTSPLFEFYLPLSVSGHGISEFRLHGANWNAGRIHPCSRIRPRAPAS